MSECNNEKHVYGCQCALCYVKTFHDESKKTNLCICTFDHKCKLEERIERLQQSRDAYSRIYKQFAERLDKLEKNNIDLKIYSDSIQQQIWQKNIIERIEKLESNELAKALDPKFWKFMSDRVGAMETELYKGQIRCIDNHNKNNKEIKELTDIQNSHAESLYILCKKINCIDNDKIQSLYNFIFGHNPYQKNLANLVQELESEIADMKQEILELEVEKDKNKKPHKCLVCNGNKKVMSKFNCKDIYEDCHACEGKGLVWE